MPGSVQIRPEQISAVTDSVPEQWRLDRMITISHSLLLLIIVRPSMPPMTLDASVISDKGRIEVTGASVPTLSAGLLQRYTSRNS